MFKAVVLDDEHLVLRWLIDLIGRENRNITVAGSAKNGEEGLSLIKKCRPDIVITDIRMPKMDGLELIKNAHDEAIPVKFVILSGYGEFEYAKQALRYGVKDYLLKPVSGEQMRETLEKLTGELLREREEQSEAEDYIRAQVFHGAISQLPLSRELTKKYYEISGCEENAPYQVTAICLPYCTESAGSDTGGLIGIVKKELSRCLSGDVFVLSPLMTALDEITIVCCYAKETSPSRAIICGIQKRMKELLDFLEKITSEKTQMPFIAGMGNIHYGLPGIKESYDEAYRAAEYASLTGKNFISINEVYDGAYKPGYPLETENSLMNAVKYRDRKKANELLTEFFDKILSNGFCTVPQFRKTCLEISAVSLRQLYSLGITRDELPGRITESENKMIRSARFDHLRQYVSDIIDEEISLLDKTVSDGVSKIVKQVLRLIDQRIALDLSVETLARLMRLTPGYLSTAFKREKGIRLVEYIASARIEKSKQLLLKPELKIREISLMVGYQDAKYFSRVFREKTGVGPAEYRNLPPDLKK